MPTPEQIAAALAFADAFPGCNDVQMHLKVLADAARPVPRPIAEYHEDHGPVVWWAYIEDEWLGEPSYIGAPDDSDWPGYHTHWTPHPIFPALPAGSRPT